MTGSMVALGSEPWPPRPVKRTISDVPLEVIAPVRHCTSSNAPGITCSAKPASGLPKRVNRPSSSMALAPLTRSSAGCPTNISVPRQRSFIATSARAVPTHTLMWMSCPQLWATNVSAPLYCAFARLAYGRPVCSSMGRPSRSVRTMISGPRPLANIATRPVLPTPSVTVNPASRISRASVAAVRVSSKASSGCACRSLCSASSCGHCALMEASMFFSRAAASGPAAFASDEAKQQGGERGPAHRRHLAAAERTAVTSISTSAPSSASPATWTVDRTGLLGCSAVPKNWR